MTVLKRVLIPLGELLVWLIVASFVVFALLSLLPGDVAQVILGANADPKAAATVRSRLGLDLPWPCLLYTSPSPRDRQKYRMPSSA